jgi:hypothetical protein
VLQWINFPETEIIIIPSVTIGVSTKETHVQGQVPLICTDIYREIPPILTVHPYIACHWQYSFGSDRETAKGISSAALVLMWKGSTQGTEIVDWNPITWSGAETATP